MYLGALDFGGLVRTSETKLFSCFEMPNRYQVLPNEICLGKRDDGTPDFRVELIRGPDPMSGPEPYGVLDLRLVPAWPLEQALNEARALRPDATVLGVVAHHAWLKLVGTEGQLLRPVEVAGDGLGAMRLTARLDRDGAMLFVGALERGTVMAHGVAELQWSGVSPRVAVTARFDPRALMADLNAISDGGVLTQDALTSFFARDPAILPFEVSGWTDSTDVHSFGWTMADRIRHQFGTPVLSTKDDNQPCIKLRSPAETDTGRFEWNLVQPFWATRSLVLIFDAFKAVNDIIGRGGLSTILRKTVTQSISSGYVLVEVSANLPDNRVGLLSCGANLRAPARPPRRMQALTETVELGPPEDRARALLRFAPNEPPAYTVQTFVVVSKRSGIAVLESEERPATGESLPLTVADFPVQFVPVEASPQLAKLARVLAVARWTEDGEQREQGVELTTDSLRACIAAPRDTEVIIQYSAELGGARVECINGGNRVDLPSFAEYGSHTVQIELQFADADEETVAIELAPEEDGTATPLFFTRTKERREWTYFARSPFASGYRYRPFAVNGPPHPWSAVQPATLSPLQLSARMFNQSAITAGGQGGN